MMDIELNIKYLQDKIEIHPERIDLQLQLADYLVKKNELAQALNIYIQILIAHPDNVEVKFKHDTLKDIITQSQLDIYACTNTHIDPWL